jgi:hypothetical protein
MTRPGSWVHARAHAYVLSLAVGTLSVTTLLKVAEIQYLELFLAADFLIISWLFVRNRMQVRVYRPFLSIGRSYAIFLALVFLLALLALRENFYPYTFTLLKRPLLVTVSRMAELFLDVFYMLFMASLYREDEALCAFGARVYYWMGVAGGVYALLTFPLNVLYQLQLGTSSVSHRFRGFDNEAGPYGTYMVSVCILTVAMYHRKWLTRTQFYAGMAFFLVLLAGSQSKAGFFVALTAACFHLLWSQSGWKRWTTIAATSIVFITIALAVDIPKQISVYIRGSETYQELSLSKSTDANFVMGRVAGTVLAPRMIAAHPLAGIGWGNYPMVRDDPAYRQGTAFSVGNVDSPGLGLIDYIVELGFPLWIYMTWIGIKPVYILRRHRADAWLLTLAMIQPISNWFGAHLNITHPWVVVGLALGMGFAHKQTEDRNAHRSGPFQPAQSPDIGGFVTDVS